MQNPFGTDKILAIAQFVPSTTAGAIASTQASLGCTVAQTGTTTFTMQFPAPIIDNNVAIVAIAQGVSVNASVTYPTTAVLASGGGFTAGSCTATITFSAAISTATCIQFIALDCNDGINQTATTGG